MKTHLKRKKQEKIAVVMNDSKISH